MRTTRSNSSSAARRKRLIIAAIAGLIGIVFVLYNGVIRTGEFVVDVSPRTGTPVMSNQAGPPPPVEVNDENERSTHLASTPRNTAVTAASGRRRVDGRSDVASAVDWLLDLVHFAEGFAAEHHHGEGNATAAGAGANADEEFCTSLSAHMWDVEIPALEAQFPEFVAMLRRQREMHAAVAAGAPMPGQKYLVWSLSGGLGNRFLSMSSTFVAAMLSGRVFLMKDWFTPLPKNSRHNVAVIHPSRRTDEYVLEPLEKLLDADDLKRGRRPPNTRLLCPLLPIMSLTEFQRMYPHEFKGATTAATAQHSPTEDHVKVDISARHDRSLVRWNRFLCSNLSETVGDFLPSFAAGGRPRAAGNSAPHKTPFFSERFVYVWTNQYYLPALYANPHHGRDLARMLPPARAYSILLRVLALPSRSVLSRISRFMGRAGLSPREYDAMQIRPFQTHAITTMSRAFDECYANAISERSAPAAGSSSTSSAFSQPRAGKSRFFLATIWPQILAYFKRRYGSLVTTQTVETAITGDQNTSDVESDQQALADMLILAMSRDLFVSPGSTFGVFAMAFGEVDVVRVNYGRRSEGTKLCERITSHQACFGSWFQRDKIFHRAKAGGLSCDLLPLPENLMNCG